MIEDDMSYQRAQNGSTGSGIGGTLNEKLNGFLDQRELPMYKDKPYNYGPSRKSVPLYRQWRFIGGIILVLLGSAYWLGLFSPAVAQVKKTGASKGAWNWLSKPDRSVDWDARREKVKDAFMLSWDGYEQYAWGTLIGIQSSRKKITQIS